MKIDGILAAAGGALDLAAIGAAARDLEALGYDGGLSAEITHDPFLPLVVAAEHTEHLQLGTSTVRTHIQHLYDKLEVNDRGQLVRAAMRRKLLD